MELVAPVLIVAAVVLAAVWATRILLLLIKVAVLVALTYALVSWLRPDWIESLPLPKAPTTKIVTPVKSI